MIRWTVLIVLLCRGFSDAAGGPISVRADERRGELTIDYLGKPLLVYAFATNQFKPYVREFHALNGVNVLRDAPADHLHHHGLMYAIRVNGVNFWEETGEPGWQRSVKLLSASPRINKRGLPEATFTQRIDWVESPSHDALLRETRTITVAVDENGGAITLDWQGDFEAGRAATVIKLTGSAYNGLGLRLPVEFDHVARHSNSGNLPYTPEQKWDVTPARWSAVAGMVKEQAITLALFGRPANAGKTRFFTMLNPFAYLAVTQSLEQRPIEYRSGENFQVRYRLAVYAGARTTAALEKDYERWLAEAP